MIRETASMMFLTTRTETEALLLEQNLIKQLKPRYNVLLRDDKSFPNILVTKDHAFPQIKKHRGAKKEKGNYYGPFAGAGAVNRTLNQLQRVFLLRNCSRQRFCNAHAALPAIPDQTLFGPLLSVWCPKRITPRPCSDAESSCRAAPRVFRKRWRRRCRRPAKRWSSSAPPPCATGSRR